MTDDVKPEPATTRSASRVLVVEDEPAIRDVVATALRYQGHVVNEIGDGTQALAMATDSSFDLIVLDVMLPGLDGFEVCRQLRDRGRFCPVLFLTARDQTEHRIQGFVAGGDDYLTKPFSVDELTLRVAAILRRIGRDGSPEVLTVDDLVLEVAAKQVRRAGHDIELSPTEFRLLHYLMINAGIVLSKTQILVNVWDYDYDGSDNVVELYIGYLRRKIDKDRTTLIHTRRGHGYVLRQPDR
ncbi:MAG: response regulator transcription factor [Ilumatobacter sp.]|uniref:response regulator transcription factor n=1 Tax=Ilumatobacter sp. TaxID=1967498 RepID=UPI003C78B809